MGIIKKQTIQNSLVNYFGIVLGYLNVSILFPKMLSMEEFGLTRILISLAAIYVQFSSLGTQRLLIRFFPLFKSTDKKHQGIFSFVALVSLVGFVLMTLMYVIGSASIKEYYQEKSPLFSKYYFLGIVTSFFLLYCTLLENYLSNVFKTVLQNIFRNVVLRLVWCVEVYFYYIDYINFDMFIYSFVLAYALNFILLLVYAIYLKQICWTFHFNFWQKKTLRKLMIQYSLFSIFSGATFILINNIDQVMIAGYLGLEAVSIYALAMYISNVMYIPMSSLGAIAFPVISKYWRERKIEEVEKIYQKSCVNLFLAGGFVFLLIWASIDEYISILPPKYAALKYVALFLAIGKMVDMATGVNTHIIAVSKHYRFETYFSLLMCILAILTNYLLIPVWQVNGAAIATAITLTVMNLLRLLFLRKTLGINSFSASTLWRSILVFLLPFMITWVLPPINNILLSIIYKTMVVSISFFILLVWLKPSEDISLIIQKVQLRFLKKVYF